MGEVIDVLEGRVKAGRDSVDAANDVIRVYRQALVQRVISQETLDEIRTIVRRWLEDKIDATSYNELQGPSKQEFVWWVSAREWLMQQPEENRGPLIPAAIAYVCRDADPASIEAAKGAIVGMLQSEFTD